MSGLIKAKKYDWKDSNMELFGSDLDRQVKKESAMGEPAWEGAGQEVGTKIWRIVKFQVTDWPTGDYGKFFDGDSYIILYTYKKGDSDDLKYDLHFWIGKNSSQDEYGTAAYKTVELDTFLDDKAVQHRECQGHESDRFKSYFPTLSTMSGGAETGFRHVEPVEYKPRLLHFAKEKRHVCVREIQMVKDNVKSSDVYIIDSGTNIIHWNGCECSKDEKFKAAQYVQALEEERGGRAKSEVIDESDCGKPDRMMDLLADDPVDDDDESVGEREQKLFILSDADGSLDFEEKKTGGITPEDFNSDDVFIFDAGMEIFVWVGDNASPSEKRNAIPYAHKYLQKNRSDTPFLPVTVVKEGQRDQTSFDSAFQ